MYSFTFLFSTILSFILGFSLIAAIHELGHLLMAKWCNIGVKRYMVFFPPTLFQWKRKETTYGIGMIPLGGMVEVEGMGEEITEGPESLPQSDFRTKAAWQRALVMVGGISFNLISAYLIIVILLMTQGASYLSKEEINKYGIAPTTIGQKVGFKRGDKIIRINGKDFLRAEDFDQALENEKNIICLVQRDKEKVAITISAEQASGGRLWHPLVPYKIKKVSKGSIAEKAGLCSEDLILSINGEPTPYLQDFEEAMSKNSDKLTIEYQRGSTMHQVTLLLGKESKLGVELASTLLPHYQRESLLTAMSKARQKMIYIITLQLYGIKKIITREISLTENLQSPVAVIAMFSEYEGLSGFFWLVAILSIILALMNLLPIPALDGFHLLITLGEMVIRRKINHKWYGYLQMLGTLFLITLTIVLILKDLYKFLL